MQPNTVNSNKFPDNVDDQKHGSIVFVAAKSYFSIKKKGETLFFLIVSIISG